MSGRVRATFAIETPWTGDGAGSSSAIAVVRISASTRDELESAMAHAGVGSLNVGQVGLRRAFDIDDAVAARFDECCVYLTPHGGPLIMQRLRAAMLAAGFVEANQATTDTSDEYPEAKDHYEACMLGALARAASPLAVDALLRQPEIWRSSTPSSGERLRPRARVMNRLLSPPMVVAVGAANVGKSSLVNALARRMVSITADEPGTTRDHVGVLLELAGLVVRWIDMPGVRTGADAADPIELEASELAREVALSADLVVICGDHRSGFLDAEMIGLRRGQLVIRCATRADLSESTSSDADVITSATTGAGLTELALAIRRVLVPDEQLEINEPWLFDERLLDNPR